MYQIPFASRPRNQRWRRLSENLQFREEFFFKIRCETNKFAPKVLNRLLNFLLTPIGSDGLLEKKKVLDIQNHDILPSFIIENGNNINMRLSTVIPYLLQRQTANVSVTAGAME